MVSRELRDPGGAEPRSVARPADSRLRRLPARALDQPFDEDGLHALRTAVAGYAAGLGAADPRTDDLVVVANELASNAVRHGGGGGRLRVWHQGSAVMCQVSDAGPGLADPEVAGRRPAPLSAAGGRGLWIVRQMAQAVDIATGPYGTTVTVTLNLDREGP